MRTHHAIRPAAPGFTGGGDEVRAKCEGNPGPFDALTDHESGPVAISARKAAWDLCSVCPLRAKCWADNATEMWLLRLTNSKLPATERVTCGKPHGAEAHRRAGEDVCAECLAAKIPQRKWAGTKVRHGTTSGYRMHRSKGEEACEACYAAQREYDRRYYHEKRSTKAKRAKGEAA